MLALQAWVMAVAQDAAQDAMRTKDRPYSSFPLVEHTVTPDMSAVEEDYLATFDFGTEQAAAVPCEGNDIGTSGAMMGLDKGVAEKSGLMTVVDIQADASSAANLTFDNR